MKYLKYVCIFLCSALLAGCSSPGDAADADDTLTFPLRGTDTAVVRIMLDEDGMPYVIEKTVVIKAGQRVVWVGPKEFAIRFPEGSPFQEDKFSGDSAVLNLVIPENADKQVLGDRREMKFKYDIIVGDKVLDPHLILIET